MRRWIPVVLLALPLALAPAPARAGTFPYWGLLFGTPERATAHVGVSFGDDIPSGASEGFALGTGPVVEASIGLGAGKIGIGRSILILILTEEKSLRVYGDLKAVATRTWDKPRGASAHGTYLGVEGGLSVSFVRFTMGVSKRLEEKAHGAEVVEVTRDDGFPERRLRHFDPTRPKVGRGGHRRDLDLSLCEELDVSEQAVFAGLGKGDGDTVASGPAGAADTVDVGLGWQPVVKASRSTESAEPGPGPRAMRPSGDEPKSPNIGNIRAFLGRLVKGREP